MQSREGIVGDLRASRRDRRDEARLAGRRVADERDIRDGLQFELNIAFPSGGAQQRESRRLPLRRRECGVAESTQTTRGHDEPHARLDHVDEDFACRVLDDSADGHRQFDVFAGGTGSVIAHAEAAVLSGPMRRVVVRQQRRHLRIGDEHDVATMAAVPPVGSSERLELLTTHRDAAVAALAGAQVQRHSIDERDHAHPPLIGAMRKGRARARPFR